MPMRHGVVAVLAALIVASCASAADVKSTGAPVQSPAATSPTTSPHDSETPTEPAATSEPPTTPPTSQETPERLVLPNTVGEISVFLTPSRNIGCQISAGLVRCDILEHTYGDPRKPADCTGDYGQSLAVDTKGIGQFVCVSDTVIMRTAPVLQYGSSTSVGDFGCTSRQTGITCYNLLTEHGFELSQASPALF